MKRIILAFAIILVLMVPIAVNADDSEILAAAEDKAIAAFQDADLKLEKMQDAYQDWSIPQFNLPSGAVNAKSNGVVGDGVTDDTDNIQDLLDNVTVQSTVYFPASYYKISGPITIDKELTLCGEPGTVFDCSTATSDVFLINPNGSPQSIISNITITGIEFEGPGLESDPALIYAKYLDDFKITNSKIRDCGYAGLYLFNCTDCDIEKCVFDNIFKTGLGYGVAIGNKCDNIIIRDNFFVTYGRHSVSTGCVESNPTPDQYPKRVFIANNYFENTTEAALDTHAPTAGPITVINNVFYDCSKGVKYLNGAAEIIDNIFQDCLMGVSLYGDDLPHSIINNTFTNGYWESIYVTCPNVRILGNVSEGGEISCDSASNCLIEGNYVQDKSDSIVITPPDNSTIIIQNNIANNGNGLHFMVKDIDYPYEIWE